LWYPSLFRFIYLWVFSSTIYLVGKIKEFFNTFFYLNIFKISLCNTPTEIKIAREETVNKNEFLYTVCRSVYLNLWRWLKIEKRVSTVRPSLVCSRLIGKKCGVIKPITGIRTCPDRRCESSIFITHYFKSFIVDNYILELINYSEFIIID
jgi:hypothetical protein